jgi:hypothetical protein
VFPRVFDKGFARHVEHTWDKFISDPNVDPQWKDGLMSKARADSEENV